MVFALTVLMGSAAFGDLVGHWTFDEGSGTTAYDSSGNGYNGTISGGAAYTTGRISTGALSFDGVDDFVTVAHNSALALANSEYTVAYWFKRESNTVAGTVFQALGNETKGFGNYTHSNNNMYLVHGSGTPNSYGNSNSAFTYVEPAEWHHVAQVYNKDGATIYLYVDGTPYAYPASGPLVDSGMNMLFGASYGGLGNVANFLTGAMDDVQIYNQMLSTSQVATVMGGGVIGVPEPSAIVLLGIGALSLLAYAWRKRK
jgi:hypothetical protein